MIFYQPWWILLFLFFNFVCTFETAVGGPETIQRSDIEKLAQALLETADTHSLDVILKLLNSGAIKPDAAGLLTQLYGALNNGSREKVPLNNGPPKELTTTTASYIKPVTTPSPLKMLTSLRHPSTIATAYPLTKPEASALPPKDNTEARTIPLWKTQSTTQSTSEHTISEGIHHPSWALTDHSHVVIDRQQFQRLADQMKRNSNELVEILRNNTATVVQGFIKIAQALEKQIQEKSNALAATVHLSANELRDDNIKLEDAMKNVSSDLKFQSTISNTLKPETKPQDLYP